MTEELMKKLNEILGKEKISNKKEELEQYSKDLSFAKQVSPKVVVWPTELDEISKVINMANELNMGIIPVSSSKGPRFHGDTVPKTENTIIMDLSKMNKILRVDKKNRVVMVEPGVTYEQLIPEAEKHDLRVLMPLYPRGTKSVLASALEREPITTPRHHWDTSDPLLCTEVTFGTGDLFRTGMAAGPGSLEEQLESGQAMKNPLGPTHFNMYRVLQGAQGSIGVISWATIKCEYISSDLKLFYIKSDKLNFLDFLYKIMKYRMPDELFILNNVNLACLLEEKSKDIENLAAKLPDYVAIYSISGRGKLAKDRIEYLEADIGDIANDMQIELLNEIKGISNNKIIEAFTKYSKDYWKLRLKNGCQDIFFVTTLENTPKYVKIVKEYLKKQNFPLDNLGIYIQPMTQGSNCHCEFDIYYNPTNAEETSKVKKIFSELSIKLMDEGAFFNRPYGEWADEIYQRVDSDISMALKKVKSIFDPNNVLNPGVLCFKGGQ
ncbi:MAG: FAD-binding oxidoreductase [Candidatus Lokiarchaeota archaeon]|nr:FAD-binding oxidoreductase [Candidatus Lokiarchaeota archaeon]